MYDSLITEKSHLDGRPDIAPSPWNEHFRIYYLTEKMRSANDEGFSALCDRVGRGKITTEDIAFLNSRIIPCPSKSSNESFKYGKVSVIVTTNAKKDAVNHQKLEELLPYNKEYNCNSMDTVLNLPERNEVPLYLQKNTGKTGNLPAVLKLKIGAPIVITTNHAKAKYREDGICNGARGYVQAVQLSKDDPERVDIIWVVFHQQDVGKLYRFEHRHLLQDFSPGHPLATPILPVRRNFKEPFGNVEYMRQNFPISVAYAITAHKCQGWTMDEVILILVQMNY